MNKKLLLGLVLFFVLVNVSSALLMEDGVVLNYDNVYFEFKNDILFDQIEVLNDRVVFNDEHELIFLSTGGDLYINIY